jgi:hypothetical protein
LLKKNKTVDELTVKLFRSQGLDSKQVAANDHFAITKQEPFQAGSTTAVNCDISETQNIALKLLKQNKYTEK